MIYNIFSDGQYEETASIQDFVDEGCGMQGDLIPSELLLFDLIEEIHMMICTRIFFNRPGVLIYHRHVLSQISMFISTLAFTFME